MNTDISHQLDLSSSLFSSREEIHEQEVNLEKLSKLSFFMETLVRGYPSYPSQGYPSDANSNKETKKVWTLQPKPSLVQLEEQLEEHHRLGAAVQPYPVIMQHHQLHLCSRGTEWQQVVSSMHHMQQGSWAASLWHVDHITQKHWVWHLSDHLSGHLLNPSQHPRQGTC